MNEALLKINFLTPSGKVGSLGMPPQSTSEDMELLKQRNEELSCELERQAVDLEAAHRELADYAARVEDLTLAAERQRMARELHDTLAQGVAGLVLQLEAADSHLAAGRAERAQGIVQQAMGRARDTLADARRAIEDLRAVPPAVDLEDALRHEVTRFTDATGIPCALDFALTVPLPEATAEHLLRIVAEGLTNIARHAQAAHAWVTIAESDGDVTIEVGDDGVGFDPTAAFDHRGTTACWGCANAAHGKNAGRREYARRRTRVKNRRDSEIAHFLFASSQPTIT